MEEQLLTGHTGLFVRFFKMRPAVSPSCASRPSKWHNSTAAIRMR